MAALWARIDTHKLRELADFDGYRREFLHLFGFALEGVDYAAEVDPQVPIAQLV